MKSVAIIGAGPAGVVAAKTFLSQGGFSVTVFEAANRAGGMWRCLPGEDGDKCSPEMRTNLSRFTVAFSDMSWNSVDLSNANSDHSKPEHASMFPKAWQVGNYVRTYAREFGVEAITKYDTRVTDVRSLENFSSWEVTYVNSITQQTRTEQFDYLIIASGFFGKPISRGSDVFGAPRDMFQHSSRFRDINTFLPGKIAVIGGGISGSEAAAQAAFQVSAAKHGPAKERHPHSDTRIYHIINRPFYCLPRYLPQNPQNPTIQDSNLAPEILPIDLVLYNLSRRGSGEISASLSTVPPDKTRKGHEFLRSVIGGDQRELGRSELVYRPEHLQYPSYTGITDTYSDFVRSGVIVPVQGWAEEVEYRQDTESFSITVQPRAPWCRATRGESPTSTVLEATGIIEATGYETNLDFLDARVKERLGYDPACPRVPILLTRGSIFAKDIDTIGFVGFYEGPYWTVMELQARLVAERFAGKDNFARTGDRQVLLQRNDSENMRAAMKEKSLQVPQFWQMDYVGLVEELSRATDTVRNDTPFGGQHGPAFAARYQTKSPVAGAGTVVQEVADVLDASHKEARFIAAAVFRGMQGMWELKRKIDSRNMASPGGTFLGTAHFHPRVPTDPTYAAEYLYIEEGTFKMDTGLSFPASRRYIYRYNEVTDKISAWFADEDGVSAGALFNTWQFSAPEDAYHGWMATGDHWCDPDTYKNTCEFRFRGAAVQTFGIIYQVEGPKKDYSHESWYERPSAEYR